MKHLESRFRGLGLAHFPTLVAQHLGHVAANQKIIIDYKGFQFVHELKGALPQLLLALADRASLRRQNLRVLDLLASPGRG